jgi:hypothetical protein
MILGYSLLFVWSVRGIYLFNFDIVGRDRLMLEALFDWLEKRLMLIYCERKTLLFRWNSTANKFKRTWLEFQFARNGKPRDDIQNAGNNQVSESTYMCPKRIYMLPFIPSDPPTYFLIMIRTWTTWRLHIENPAVEWTDAAELLQCLQTWLILYCTEYYLTLAIVLFHLTIPVVPELLPQISTLSLG